MSQSDMKMVGLDVFVRTAELPAKLGDIDLAGFELKVISNRGTKVWPAPTPPIHMTDVYCCRFMQKAPKADALELLKAIEQKGFTWVHIEKLHEINGKPGFGLAQGE